MSVGEEAISREEENIPAELIPVDEIMADESFNCRGYIAPSSCIDLARSIGKDGLNQPIMIQPYEYPDHPEKKYRIVMGHRRYTAITYVLKWTQISAMVKHGLSEQEALILNLGENLQREPLNIIQEAKAIKRLRDAGLNQLDVARELRKERPWVQTRFYVLDFPEDIQSEIADGLMNQAQIHAVHALPEEQWYEAVRAIKDAKIRGEARGGKKPNLKKLKPPIATNLLKAKPRKPDEIEILLDHFLENSDPDFHTRILAWCVGEVTTMDLLRDFRDEQKIFGKNYIIPTEGIPGL